MVLCFGIFAKTLSLCRQKTPEIKLIARIAWTVDRMNSCLGAGLDYEIPDDELDIKSLGNAPVVSRLLSCEQDFALKRNKKPTVEIVCKGFKDKVMPFLAEDKVAKAVLAVRKIIALDETIDDTRKETFNKFLGMYKDEFLQQTSFDVPAFFAKVLLYTTCINNRDGQPYANMISNDFIEDAVGTDWAKLNWNASAQTLELIPTGEKRLSELVDRLYKLRPSIGEVEDENEYANMEWLGIDLTDLDPSIYGRTEIRASDAQKLLAR